MNTEEEEVYETGVKDQGVIETCWSYCSVGGQGTGRRWWNIAGINWALNWCEKCLGGDWILLLRE